MQSSLQLTGIGLQTPHSADIMEKKPDLAWLEIHAENYFSDGGKSLQQLDQLRESYPISIHCQGMSLGSADDLNWRYLNQVKELATRIDACLISDHLAWSSIDGQYVHDQLPIPYTEEALKHIVERVQRVQDFLQREILIENVTSYLAFEHNQLPEYEFLTALASASGCGILLDINSLYINSRNLHLDADQYISNIPGKLIQEIHLSGFSSQEIHGHEVLLASHDRAIVPAVWSLFERAIAAYGRKPTIIEWDKHLPSLDTLCLEAFRAEKIMRECYDSAKLTG